MGVDIAEYDAGIGFLEEGKTGSITRWAGGSRRNVDICDSETVEDLDGEMLEMGVR